MLARSCSECGKSLAGLRPQAKTHNAACRKARSVRLRTEARGTARDAARVTPTSEPMRALYDIVQRKQTDVVKKVVEEQLAPIVRDALTEETLHAIKKLLGLTGAMVLALEEDLTSEDPVIRQRAYALGIKYTVGHPALVKSDDADGSKQINVHFGLPRPDAAATFTADDEAEVVKTCDLCNEEKVESEFVAGSDRCQPCADEWKLRITEQFA